MTATLVPLPHGTLDGWNGGCRCIHCTAAHETLHVPTRRRAAR